jgi:hypothetical protein
MVPRDADDDPASISRTTVTVTVTLRPFDAFSPIAAPVLYINLSGI